MDVTGVDWLAEREMLAIKQKPARKQNKHNES